MCGITGILCFDPQARPDRQILEPMIATLAPRGPDDAGWHQEGPISLGFRRLSILDLSPAGHQPMANENRTVWLVCNGEIYNYAALRKSLQACGHVFHSHTDVETILHGYEEWGDAILERLEGMFALALWDAQQQKLLLARDRFGIKPLHYAILPHALVFGSEIKALLKYPEMPRTLDAHALWNFLTFAQVPAPDTIYQAIRKLLPGHALTCHAGQTSIRRFFDLPHNRPLHGPPEELAVELRDRLDKAVQSHLNADVPVGCFLSGGLDSSLITALAARHHAGRLQTFSVVFDDQPSVDESAFQKIVSEQYNTEHHVLRARTDLTALVPDMLRATDEPFAISSFMPLYHLARMTRDHVKVVLSGDGSDELFAGYGNRYRNDMCHLGIGRLLHPLLASPHPQEWIWRNRTVPGRLLKRIFMASCDEHERYISSYNWFSNLEKQALLQPDVFNLLKCQPCGEYLKQCYDPGLDTPLERKLRYEMLTSLSDEMMTKTDRACSAFGLEGRVPFLDRNVVDYAWNIHPNTHWHDGAGKLVLKAAARGLLPDAIIDRRKQGFAVPLDHWLRQDPAFLRPVLLTPDPTFEQWINPAAIRAMLHAHDTGAGNLGERLWLLYVLKVWLASTHLT